MPRAISKALTGLVIGSRYIYSLDDVESSRAVVILFPLPFCTRMRECLLVLAARPLYAITALPVVT